jgi:endonuclease YncB( thermonuclease family)
MAEIPPQRPSRLRSFWTARSRKGKFAIVVGAVVLALVAIGYAAPPESDDATQDVPTTATSEQATTEGTTEAETTTEAEPPLLVANVIDGDTLDLDNGDRIRLVQIDAPEGKGECYGKKAGRVLRQLLPVSTEIRLEADPNLDDVDRYGRLLRYVFNGEQNVSLVLVQKGAASVWYFNGDKGRYAKELLRAAKRASTARRGAWGACEAKLDPMRAFRTQPKRNEPNPVTPGQEGCEPGYSPCLPITGDLDCPDIEAMGLAPVTVTGSDRYRLDGDGDGTGCE